MRPEALCLSLGLPGGSAPAAGSNSSSISGRRLQQAPLNNTQLQAPRVGLQISSGAVVLEDVVVSNWYGPAVVVESGATLVAVRRSVFSFITTSPSGPTDTSDLAGQQGIIVVMPGGRLLEVDSSFFGSNIGSAIAIQGSGTNSAGPLLIKNSTFAFGSASQGAAIKASDWLGSMRMERDVFIGNGAEQHGAVSVSGIALASAASSLTISMCDFLANKVKEVVFT